MTKILFFLATLLLCLSSNAKQLFTITAPEGHYLLPLAQQIVTEVYQPLDIEIELLTLPTARSLRYVNDGLADAELARVEGIEQEFTDLMPVPVPLVTLYLIAVARTADVSIKSMQQARGGRVAIKLGSKYVEQYTKDWKVIQVESMEQQLQLLVNARVDYILIDAIQPTVNLTAVYKGHLHQRAIQRVSVYHYIHKKHQQLLPALTAELQRLHNSGRIDAIIEQFIQQGIDINL